MARKRTVKKIPREIVPYVWGYIYLLEKQGVPVDRAYLFGSWAKGTQHRWSDIDLAIVSPKFNSWIKTQELLSHALYEDLYSIEPHGFHPKDFTTNFSLGEEIKKTGIRIL